MSFSRHGEIYHCEEGATLADHAPAHRNDESPAGYSLAGCSPAVPASASPAAAIMLWFISRAKDFAANGKLSLITVSHPRGSLQTERYTGLLCPCCAWGQPVKKVRYAFSRKAEPYRSFPWNDNVPDPFSPSPFSPSVTCRGLLEAGRLNPAFCASHLRKLDTSICP